MSITAYGYYIPETRDEGAVVFPGLEANWTQVSAHNHDGVNSALINTANLEKTTIAILSASFVETGGGTSRFTQNVTLTGALLYDDVILAFKLSTGEPVYPKITKFSASVFTIEVDTSADITCYVN